MYKTQQSHKIPQPVRRSEGATDLPCRSQQARGDKSKSHANPVPTVLGTSIHKDFRNQPHAAAKATTGLDGKDIIARTNFDGKHTGTSSASMYISRQI
jgi:hypothetical protein